MKGSWIFLTFVWIATLFNGAVVVAEDGNASSTQDRPRIIVCTDIGGSDYDDFQSMVHLLVYADRFDIEGLVSSPMGGTGRKEFIVKVIDVYKHDYPNLHTYSDHYPPAEQLRSLSKQGSTDTVGVAGFGKPTEGSEWIIQCAKRPDPRPLWILVWGGLEDVAQALHDDPVIKAKLRVYFIGGPNKKWSPRAYDYIAQNHPDLWMIEDNSSYYGWFIGGNQQGDLENTTFVVEHLRGCGALGDYFAGGIGLNSKIRSNLKMGDTPSVAYMFGKTREDPTKDSWGGRFVRAWDRHRYVFDHAPSAADQVETYSIVEIRYQPPTPAAADAKATLVVSKQEFPGFADKGGVWHFVYCPKEPGKWEYTIRSTDPKLDGQIGAFTSYLPPPNQPVAVRYPHWWTDDPDPVLAEGIYQGAKTVNRWREDYLRDFAQQMKRCQSPASEPQKKP
jgi:hypothetical protein